MKKLYLASSIDLTAKLDGWQYVKVEGGMYKIVEIDR